MRSKILIALLSLLALIAAAQIWAMARLAGHGTQEARAAKERMEGFNAQLYAQSQRMDDFFKARETCEKQAAESRKIALPARAAQAGLGPYTEFSLESARCALDFLQSSNAKSGAPLPPASVSLALQLIKRAALGASAADDAPALKAARELAARAQPMATEAIERTAAFWEGYYAASLAQNEVATIPVLSARARDRILAQEQQGKQSLLTSRATIDELLADIARPEKALEAMEEPATPAAPAPAPAQ